MTDLIASGENGRSSGYDYEDVIVKLINNYNSDKEGYKIVSFICNDLGLEINDYKIYAIKCPKNVDDIFYDGKGTSKKAPKADAHIYFKNIKTNNIIKKGISIKSSGGSIQVLITNVNAFIKVCNNYGIKSDELIIKSLSKFCGFSTYKPSLLLNADQISYLEQGRRDRRLINELENEEQLCIKEFFTINQRSITEIVLKKGSGSKEYRADYYLVNKNEFSRTGIIDFNIDNIDSVINRAIDGGYRVTDKGSFHIGHITVQMKGSGKGESYHGLQFNKKGI